MAYAQNEVDIPLYGMNQVLPERSGPAGRVKTVINAQTKKFIPAANTIGVNTPAQITIEPRDGIASLPATARSVVTGAPASLSWNTPQLLDALGNQLIDIVGGVPRVWNGANWTAYPNNTVVTHDLTQDVWHTPQGVINVSSSATLNGVTCGTWTDVVSTSTGPLTTSRVGFRSKATKAWVMQPTTLFAAATPSTRTQAKVVSDGTNFYVFWNDASVINVGVYDTNGVQLGTLGGGIGLHSGIWDATPAVTGSPNTGTVLFAQALSGSANSGVFLTSLGFTGPSTVTAHSFLDNTIQCAGPLSWLTNDSGNGLAYLATGKVVAGPNYEIHGYEISGLAQVHDFNTGYTIATTQLDSLTGYVTGTATLVISLGWFPVGITPAHGPKADPALRYLQTVSVDRSNVAVTGRRSQSFCQVSKAFAIDGNYHVVGYYQSGSGSVITPQSQAVSITGGEYMLGAAVQPVTVNPGDYVTGGTLTGSGAGVQLYRGTTALGILNGDVVAPYTAVASDPTGQPVGTPLLKWTFANLPIAPVDQPYIEGTLSVSGSSIGGANNVFNVLYNTGHTLYTPATSLSGSPAVTGTFTAGGTFQVIASALYFIPALATVIDPSVTSLYSSFTWSGDSVSGNNGLQSILRFVFNSSGQTTGIVVVAGTQGQSSTTSSYSIAPTHPNMWSLSALAADGSYVGSNLVSSNDLAQPNNNGSFPITSIQGLHPVTTGAPTVSEFFSSPFPTIDIDLGAGQIPYTFHLPNVTFDYTYQGALISVQGATETANNGVYAIQTILDTHTVVATRTDGSTNQVNEQFTGGQTITIFFLQNIAPLFQPTWFLVPLLGTQPVTGRFEYGSAYADWRIEGDATLGPNLFPFSLSVPSNTGSGTDIMLPYRAQNVTTAVPLVTAAGQVAFAEEFIGSTVGLKLFTLATTVGQAFRDPTSLTIPGPMAQVFTQSGFFESGINLAPEQPFLVSQSVAGGTTLGLTKGARYLYQVVDEYTDENGDLIESIPSPIFTVTMSGTNNVATLGGRMAFPLSTTGQPIANTYGTTTRNVTKSLYRTAIAGGIATTQKYKITNDLSPNQLAPISTLNPSGFSFPDPFTWQYIDCNPDVGLTDAEDIYTDGELARYPAPAFSRGIGNFKNRDLVIGYDGAVWISFEHEDGQAVAYHPALRWTFPATDQPKAIGFLDDSVYVFCQSSIQEIPLGGATLPARNGVGALPTPVPLPWPNGSANGFALSIPDLVVYDSTAGGLWAITRAKETLWLSHAVIDLLTNPICGLALDGAQKLYVQQTNSNNVLVYDHVPGVWGVVATPTAPKLIASYQGNFAYQDTGTVNVTSPGSVNDVIAGTTYGIAPDITFALVSLSNVRGLKKIWGLQMVGKYLGPHRINIVISYPDDNYPDQLLQGPFTPDPTKPYIIPFYLMNEEVTTFGLRIYADFVGVGTPGASFSLELLTAEIGVEGRGIAKLPDSAAAM